MLTFPAKVTPSNLSSSKELPLSMSFAPSELLTIVLAQDCQLFSLLILLTLKMPDDSRSWNATKVKCLV